MNQDKAERMEYFISLLDDYLDGKLENGKTGEIEKMIKEDDFYAEVLRQHVQVRANIRVAGEEELKKKLTSQFEARPTESLKESNPVKLLLPIILLLIVAAAAYYFLTHKDNDRGSKPYLENVENADGELLLASVEDPSYDLLRSESSSDVADLWQTTVQHFISKNYEEALNGLSELEQDDSFVSSHNGKLSLMKGVAELKLENFSVADQALSLISIENPYYDQAQWYRALVSYYGQDDDEAKSRLMEISNSKDHYQRDRAKIYLDRISK